jgi:hypothetical protein
LFRLSQQGDIGARSEKCFGFQTCSISLRTVFGKARQLWFKRCNAAFSAGIARGQFTLRPARGGCCNFCGAARCAGGGFGAGGFRFRAFGSDARGFRFRCGDLRLIKPRFGGA